MKNYKGYIEKRGTAFRAVLWKPGRMRETATFKTKALAKNWLAAKSVVGERLTFDQMQDAIEALYKLPDGVTLQNAADHYLDTALATLAETNATILADIYLGERSGLRPRTLEGYRQDLNRAIAWSNDLTEWTKSNIMQWSSKLTPSKKNHIVATLRAFLQWCADNGHLTQNPLEGVKAEKIDNPKRQVLTIPDVEHLLRVCRAQFPEMIHYVAICLFAGIRPDECKRLKPENLQHDYIVIDETIAKTHSARTVEMHENLKTFLSASPLPAKGVMLGSSWDNFRKRMTALIKASGITWANDIMRHSYASYEYERSKDAAATAANLGHTSTTMLFKHYRGLVAPGAGEKFFKIQI